MNNILSYASINGAYPFINLNKNTISYDYLLSIYLNEYLSLIKKYDLFFGLFISVERINDKLNKFPEEIHGCIGNFNDDFTKFNNVELFENAISLGYKSAFIDSRKKYFQSLLFDYNAIFKVSYMIYNIYKINKYNGYFINNNNNKFNNSRINTIKKNIQKIKKTNKKTNKKIKFTNNKYGLIVKKGNDSKATYLPGVFKNIEWNNIKERLMNKGGVINNNNISYNAYEVYEESVSLINFFTNDIILCLRYFEIILESEKLFKNNIPPYSIYNNNISYDNNQYVRNCGYCSDLIKSICYLLKNILINKKHLKKIKKVFINSYNYLLMVYNYYLNSMKKFRQASSFIIVGFAYILCHKKILKKYDIINFYNKLNFDLDTKDMINYYNNDILNNFNELDKNFEFGECGVALFTSINFKLYNSNNINKWLLYSNSLIDEINTNSMDNIFRLNWMIQMYCQIVKKYNKYYLLTKLINKLFIILDKYYLNKIKKSSRIDSYKLNNLNIETNFIAVAYEACMNIYNIINDKNINHIKIKNNIKKYIVLLSIILINRKDNKGFYKFINRESRLDITGHTIIYNL